MSYFNFCTTIYFDDEWDQFQPFYDFKLGQEEKHCLFNAIGGC